MNKRVIYLTLGCFAMSITIVALLFGMSGAMRDKRNNFLRQFPPHPAMEGDSIPLRYNSYYIAGGTQHHVYLANYKAPLHMIVVNLHTLDTQQVRLTIKDIQDKRFWNIRIKVDSPHYYLTDGTVPIIFKGNVENWYAEQYLMDSIYFRELVPMKPGVLAVKSLSGKNGENILGKISERAPYWNYTESILQKQLDGVFCTDGMLRYNEELNQLVYIYYYRNEFMVVDTSLNLVYQGHTIDTTSKAKIKVSSMGSAQTKTLAAPPFFVNKGCSVSGDWMFIHSNLLAKNEHPDAFDDAAVIDVYNMKNGKYLFSFYVYDYWGTKPMIEFRVMDNKMVVMYDRLLRIFDLQPQYFKEM